MLRNMASCLGLGLLLSSISVAAQVVKKAPSGPIASIFVSEPPENVAAPAMERAVARSVAASFSYLGYLDTDTPDDDGTLSQNPPQENDPQQTKPPASSQGPPSVKDLGFPPEATKPNPQEQARLDKRSRMLKTHQRLGLITAVPLVATVITGGMAGGRQTSSANRDLHAALGSLTAGLYFTTAYYAIFAPKIQGTPSRGPIRLHKAMAWIHGPGMILTPILGEMAFAQKSRGERVHGIASAHGAVAIVTAGAYGLAMLAVSLKF